MYNGYTHFWPFNGKYFFKLWKRFLCKRGIHLWDEVYTGWEHYMICDACEEIIYISKVVK